MMALGGSTNALIHLFAIAGRVGAKLGYEEVDRISGEVPLLVDVKPAGAGYMDGALPSGPPWWRAPRPEA